MKKTLVTLLALCAAAFSLCAQTDWKGVQRLIDDGSYKTAYGKAEAVYNNKKGASRQRLTAAYYMAMAAARYQEEAYDSAVAHYRALLPSLDGVDRALCYAFLGVYDTALADSALLQRTPVEAVREFCYQGDKAQNMTPTVYDMLVVMMQDRGELTPRQRVEWQQRLCALHAGDRDDVRIWHDRRLLDFMEQVPNQPVNLSTYQQYIDKYRGTKSGQVAALYLKAANHCRWQRKDLVQAVRYCDTALVLFPKSEGGVECTNLRSQITAPRISPSRAVRFLTPQREELMGVEYANLDRLHLRIVEEPEKYMSDEQLAKLKALREWTVDVPRPDAYGEASAAFALPALPTGKYRLLLAPTANFAKGMAYAELHVTDIALRYTTDGRGLVVDRINGAPVAGQKVQLVQPKQYYPKQDERVLQTVVTAADGTYRFDSIPPRYSIIRIVRDGYNFVQSAYSHNHTATDGHKTQFHMVSDRPVYRPGDTVQVAMLLYRTDGREGELLAAGHTFTLTLTDPNGQQVQQLKLTTDDFGSAHCALPLPTDRLAGHWTVQVSDSTGSDMLGLRVEEYKQPRFMVSLSTEGAAPQFGRPYAVQGMAAAYSGVSIGGARVQYTVTRSQRVWRWGPSMSTVVAQGETEAAADGTFRVVFTPEPDSSVELSAKPVFNYTVQVTVTDLNGESHDAETTLRVGYRRLFVKMKDIQADMRELPSVQVELTDVNGTPQQGRVGVSVARLHRPDPMRLTPAVLTKGMHITIDSADYRRRFPQYIYDINENDRKQWAAEWLWTGTATDGNVSLPHLQGGIYRIVAWALDGQDTVADTVYTVLTPPTDRMARTDAALWVDRDKTTAHPGERVTFRLGSAYKGVKAYYRIEYGERQTLRSGWLTLGERLQEVTVDVDSAQLGGLTLSVSTMLHGQSFTESRTVDVTYSHKELKVEIASFRDKLLPGEQEEWTISVRSCELGVKSSLVMTMYDDALNTYGTPSWDLWPWRGHSTVGLSLYAPYLSYNSYNGAQWRNYNGSYPTVWSLVDALPHYWGGRGRIMYKTAMARNAAVVTTELAVVEDDVEEATLEALQTSASGAAMAADKGMEVEEAEEALFSVVEKEPEVQLRANLSTLAFFAPDVRTDSAGTATYRFTVPELLTRWNVRGLAVTKDLKSGTLSKTLVTAKPLMVQPNMPRFLRSGDSLSLMAKIVVSEQRSVAREVDVSLLLTDAATGDTLCRHTEHVLVKDAAQVMFDVEVPHDVYVATYRITAVADGMSDGEQGQVPVVSNRQAVTVSQAMYINGAGEKRYTMPEWLAGGDTRQPQLVAAEAVSDPVWLAVKSMPYLKSFENPSTLYLAEQLYVDGLGQRIAGRVDLAAAVKDSAVSRLAMNDDVKQTALQATPWLRDAESEEEQMRAVANYLDSAAMRVRHGKLVADLAERQNADGGWAWMPEGKSSLWVTQAVLQKVKGEDLDTRKALRFVDSEQQRYYERWIKPYIKKYKWQPTDIDYLYMRSLYGKAGTEAYKFYYANALKHYREYDNFYTQAQLALIFHRHGDRKAALDLLRRLKEKALESDEMGMYWRDNRSGWYWYCRPIETQALLINAFAEITPEDTVAIGLMQQWLLKQKQTTHWGNSRATAEAIGALMVKNDELRVKSGADAVMLTVFGTDMTAESKGAEGYRSQRWSGADLDALRASGSSDIVISKLDNPSAGGPAIAWGAVYYQFTDDLDKIPASESGITLRRTYQHEGPLKVGDRVKVRIDITCDRAMDYLELIDGRPSCVEPVSTRAGWRWSNGLGYYVTVNSTDTRCYVEHIDKGKYYFEYEVYVTNPGSFMTGVATMQCMYAPEFRATAPAQTLVVEP